MTILDKIIAHKTEEVAATKGTVDVTALQHQATAMPKPPSLRQALLDAPGGGIIAEFKRRSPSKGSINASAKLADIVPAYERAGATAISVLADSTFFGGSVEDVAEACRLTRCPVLFKEFVIDEVQLLQARAAGASAVLLIAAAIGCERCHRLAAKAKAIGLEVLLEIHGADELPAYNTDIDIIGVNNRDLKSFVTDPERSLHLLPSLPPEAVCISESGLLDPVDGRRLLRMGYNGLLVGEAFMRTADPANALRRYLTVVKA